MSSNYFVRHWRGELSLPIAYWVNGSLLVGVGTSILRVFLDSMTDASLRQIALASILLLLFSVVAWLWGVVGIWRSALNHKDRGGSAVWANLAKFMVIVGALVMAIQLNSSIVPQIKALGEIAVGNDPIGKVDVTVAANGQSVIVTGMLREGSAEQVKKILDAAPGAKTLVLNSNGGRLLEAQQLADTVRARKLNTYVEGQCNSACTYVFLAGVDRAATPNAKIGFHQPDFVGLDANAKAMMMDQMANVYKQAGLPATFIERVRETRADSMWYPTREELAKANVISRVSLGGETAANWTAIKSKADLVLMIESLDLYKAYEKRFPGFIELAADKAWAAKELGKSDGEIQNEVRDIISQLIPTLLKSADDETLVKFVNLFMLQAKAARAVSPEACSLYIDGKLDITKTLPKQYVDMEKTFMIDALAALPRTDKRKPSDNLVQDALAKVVNNLSPEYQKVAADFPAYNNQPALKCDVTLAIYQNVLELAPKHRKYALYGMLQAD